MSRFKFLGFILGCCVAAQLSPADNNSFALNADVAMDSAVLPRYHRIQSRELLNDIYGTLYRDNTAQEAMSLAMFVHERVATLLPESFKEDAPRVAQTIIDASNRYKMDPLFLMSVIQHESKFNPASLGSHGEIGLMQMKPDTAAWLLEHMGVANWEEQPVNVRLMDPAANVAIGAAYLAYLRENLRGNKHLFLAAYNMGAGKLRSTLKSGLRPRIYSDKVIAEYRAFAREFSSRQDAPNRSVASITSTFDLNVD